MQISTVKILKFEKLLRSPSNRTKVNLLKKNFFGYLFKKKIGFAYAHSPRKCSDFEILAKIDGREAKFFRKFTKGI
jgi:hypothetical protein